MLILAQTDTTAGFLSRDARNINAAKKRPLHQAVLQTLPYLRNLAHRVPKSERARVRRAQKTTFALNRNYAFRIVPASHMHHGLLETLGPLYSSSANKHQEKFNLYDAMEAADMIVFDRRGFFEAPASKLMKLGKNRRKVLR